MKSKEIVKKFYGVIFDITNGVDTENDKKRLDAAKACAHIYVDGMIEMAYDYNASEDGKKLLGEEYFKDYWQQVKQSI